MLNMSVMSFKLVIFVVVFTMNIVHSILVIHGKFREWCFVALDLMYVELGA